MSSRQLELPLISGASPRLSALASVVAIALWSSAAVATRDFPGVMRSHLRLSYEPPCSVCHLVGNTGPGTVRTPLGMSLLARGMVRRDDPSLERALDALAADNTDSDGDGDPDVAELKAQVDPNSDGNTQLDAASDPSFGCGGGDNVRSRGAAMPAFAFAVLGWIRRRARTDRCSKRAR